MAVYERSSRVAAPLEDVWDFHSTVDGLVALTPGWMNMRVEFVTGPDGEADPEVLEAGSLVGASVRPFGVGPRQTWTSRIVERRREGDRARFTDRMEEGPFRRWEHRHTFEGVDGETVLTDRVEYEFPLGPLSSLSILGRPFFEPFFSYRHRRTRLLLE